MKALFTVSLFILISCNSDNNKIFEKLKQEFSDSIAKNNAKKFDYQYDGLVPQNSFFVGNKLKYLEHRQEPELGSIESLVFFDLQTDSITKIIRREVYREWDDYNNKETRNFTDSVFVILSNPKQVLTFVGNKQVDSSLNIEELVNREFIKEIKEVTEKRYNGN